MLRADACSRKVVGCSNIYYIGDAGVVCVNGSIGGLSDYKTTTFKEVVLIRFRRSVVKLVGCLYVCVGASFVCCVSVLYGIAGHFEVPPYTDSTMRSVYHLRQLEVQPRSLSYILVLFY